MIRPYVAFAGVCQVGEDIVVSVPKLRLSGEEAEKLRQFVGLGGVRIEVTVAPESDEEAGDHA